MLPWLTCCHGCIQECGFDAAAFTREVGNGIMPSWVSIAQEHGGKAFTEDQRQWQLLRRGRYLVGGWVGGGRWFMSINGMYTKDNENLISQLQLMRASAPQWWGSHPSCQGTPWLRHCLREG
jgi:hypothetical protein